MSSNLRINGVPVADVALSMLHRTRSATLQNIVNPSLVINTPPSGIPPQVIPASSNTLPTPTVSVPTNTPQIITSQPETQNKRRRGTYEKHSFQEILYFLQVIDEIGESNPEAVLEKLHIRHFFESWKNDSSGHQSMSNYLRELKVEKRSCLLKNSEYQIKPFEPPTFTGTGRSRRKLQDSEVRSLQEAHATEQLQQKKFWEDARELLLKMINTEKLGSTNENITEEELLESIENQGKKRKTQKDIAKGRLMNAFSTDMSSREKLNKSIDHYGVLLEKAHQRMDTVFTYMMKFYTSEKVNNTTEDCVTMSEF